MVNNLALFSKKIVFAAFRLRQEVSLYESKPQNSDKAIRVLHVGDAFRGRDFIERFFGHLPKRRVVGTRFALPFPNRFDLLNDKCDILMVEINRLYAGKFRYAGYFTIPQWVEFGRNVVINPGDRYKNAKRSLKSDLNRIRKSNFKIKITKNPDDFSLFYKKMYQPYLIKRFGSAMIAKTKKKLLKDFFAGFLILIASNEQPIAGAIVKVDNNTATETTFSVIDGEMEYIKSGVSGFIDYYLHEWAASNNISYINVGHTRPFPFNGIFFNKRKWLMSVLPDHDGVMDMAIKINKDTPEMLDALGGFPFVFHNRSGLGVFCTYTGSEKAKIEEVEKLRKRFWTQGLKGLIILSHSGFQENAVEKTKELFGPDIYLIKTMGEAIELQKHNFEMQ